MKNRQLIISWKNKFLICPIFHAVIDGASNMSGCYNGLQAIIKEKVGELVVYVHCYAHKLNLVLSDSAGEPVQVIKLFDNLEMLHKLFRKSQKIHNIFEFTQNKLKVISLKRITTMR